MIFNYIRQLRHNFVARIIFIMVFTMVILAGFFDYVLITMQKKSYEQDMIRNGLADVKLLAQTTRFGVFAENELDLLPAIDGFLDREDVAEIILLNEEGEVIIKKSSGEITDNTFNTLAELERIVHNSQTYSHMCLQKENGFIFFSPVYFVSADISEEGLFWGEHTSSDTNKEIIGYAAIVLKNDMHQQRVAQILFRTGLFVFLFLVIGIILAVLIIRRVIKPLHVLLKKVRQGVGIVNQYEDINLLTETYSNLIGNLADSIETIKVLKDGLEEKVEERTVELSKANKELVHRQQKLEQANIRLAETILSLRETQDQLIQSEKLASIGQLVAGVAHEINNTINFISGALPSLKRSLADVRTVVEGYDNLEGKTSLTDIEKELQTIKAKKEEVEFAELFATIDLLLTNIDEGTNRTAAIISDLRIFSRNDTEKTKQADLHALLESTLTFVDKKLLRGVEIRKDFGNLGLVACLPGRISQVFLNILNNAMQAMEGQGILTIRSWQDKGFVHVSFTDTGSGIKPEIMNRIFDPFFTSKEVGQGCGLGLGISYEIIKQHGGQIKVESKEGKGSVFEIVLPLAKE